MLVSLIALMEIININNPLFMDEYMYYRLVNNLPNYYTNADWIYQDRPELLKLSESLPKHDYNFYAGFYTQPFGMHNPLEPYLCYPVVKLADGLASNGVIRSLDQQRNPVMAEDETIILRSFAILLVTITMIFIYAILYKRIGWYALFTVVPYVVGREVLIGTIQFQWDVWMMLFLFATWFVMDYYPKSKLKYVLGCLLVNTKLFLGLVFLGFPFFKNRKMFWCVFSILPFFIISYFVTHDLFRWYTRSHSLSPLYYQSYTDWVFPTWRLIFASYNLWFFFGLLIPVAFLFKKYPLYCLFYLGSLIYGFFFGMSITHLQTFLYGAALVFPLVMHWMLSKEPIKVN